MLVCLIDCIQYISLCIYVQREIYAEGDVIGIYLLKLWKCSLTSGLSIICTKSACSCETAQKSTQQSQMKNTTQWLNNAY